MENNVRVDPLPLHGKGLNLGPLNLPRVLARV